MHKNSVFRKHITNNFVMRTSYLVELTINEVAQTSYKVEQTALKKYTQCRIILISLNTIYKMTSFQHNTTYQS